MDNVSEGPKGPSGPSRYSTHYETSPEGRSRMLYVITHKFNNRSNVNKRIVR